MENGGDGRDGVGEKTMVIWKRVWMGSLNEYVSLPTKV